MPEQREKPTGKAAIPTIVAPSEDKDKSADRDKTADKDKSPSKRTAYDNIQGIPIAAKFKGPGPLYSLPSTVGMSAGFVGRNAPAYSFGVKIELKQSATSPGPAAFSPSCVYSSPAFSLQGGFKKERKNGAAVIIGSSVHSQGRQPHEVDLDNPGPARYNVNFGGKPAAPAYTITSRSFRKHMPVTPGPAAYSPPTCIGARQVSVPSSPAPTIAATRSTKVDEQSPGPAAYQPVAHSKVYCESPAYSLGGRPSGNPKSRSGQVPGPGSYNPSSAVWRVAPSYSFRTKHSDYEYFVPEEQDNATPGSLVLK